MSANATVFVVDDDAQYRDAVGTLAQNMNLRCRTYESGREFINDYHDSQTGCLVMEVRIPGLSGLDLQRWLSTQSHPLPVVFLTAHGTVPVAVRAMQAGAVHFLEKPPQEQELWDAVQKAVSLDQQRREILAEKRQLMDRLAMLTPKEQDVLRLLAWDKSTKVIARELEVSLRTVEFRRARILQKLNVKTPLGLAHFAIRVFEGNGQDPESGAVGGNGLEPLEQHADVS